jgi:hypothetical protein
MPDAASQSPLQEREAEGHMGDFEEQRIKLVSGLMPLSLALSLPSFLASWPFFFLPTRLAVDSPSPMSV